MARKVLVTGTFDILHKGHLYFLGESKKHGDYLIVVVATDKTLNKIRKEHANNEKIRLANIKKIPLVDEAVLGYEGKDKLKIVVEKRPDVICLGYDQSFFTQDLEKKLMEKGLDVEIARIKAFRPSVYKSSKLRERK